MFLLISTSQITLFWIVLYFKTNEFWIVLTYSFSTPSIYMYHRSFVEDENIHVCLTSRQQYIWMLARPDHPNECWVGFAFLLNKLYLYFKFVNIKIY
jgi:hypothetical protein